MIAEIAESLEQLAVNIDLPQPHPRNPKHGVVPSIKESLVHFGQVRPILVQKGTWFIVAGNHTFKSAKELGWDRIAAVQVEMTDDDALRYMLADNRLADLGNYDEAVMREIYDDLARAGKLTMDWERDHQAELAASAEMDGLLHGTELIPLDDLKEHPRNYKEHTEEQLAHLGQSLLRQGFYKNIVVANDNTILAGHGIIEAARRVGITHAPAAKMDYGPDDERALHIVASDNELSRQAAVNDRALTDMLKELAEGLGLEGTGFDEAMLANLTFITRSEGEVKDVNAAAEWVGMPDFDPVVLKPKLMLTFETLEEREQMIEKLGLIISKRERRVVSSWYPPKEREDIESLRWEPSSAEPPEPTPEPTPEAEPPAVEPPNLSPNHPASGNLTPEELDESGYDGPMLPDTPAEPPALDEPSDEELRAMFRREAEQKRLAAQRETAPKDEAEQPDRTVGEAAAERAS